MRVILGDGLLGKALHDLGGYHMVSRKTHGIDFLRPSSYANDIWRFTTVINCIGYNDQKSENKKLHWDTNYVAVYELARVCERMGKKLVHISTDSVYSNTEGIPSEEDVPVSSTDWYSYTKLLGDAAVQMIASNYLICRGAHLDTPFKHSYAWTDRVGNFDYVDIMAGLIHGLIQDDASGVYNVGTEEKTMYDLAKKTNPLVKESLSPPYVPKDTRMDVSKMMNFLKIKNWIMED